MPMVTASESRCAVHSLLDHGPITVRRDNECVQVDLKSVGDAVIVDLCRQAAGAYQLFAIQTLPVGDHPQFVGRLPRLFAPAAAHEQAEFGGTRIQAAL